MDTPMDFSVDIGGLRLKNPVMTASGTFGYGREFEGLTELKRLGAIVVKGISLEPSKGNPPPRIVETTGGMLNAIGLENVGLAAFIDEKLPYLSALAVPVVVNIYGKTVEEYANLAKELDGQNDVTAIEVNISCPNVKAGGVAFGVRMDQARAVVQAVREKTGKPVMVKTVSQCDRYHRDCPGRGSGRGRFDLSDQYPDRHGHRHSFAPPEACQCHRRAVRPGHQTHCPSNGMANGPGGEHSGDRYGRDHVSGRCHRIHHRRCFGRTDRDSQFCQSPGHHGYSGWHRGVFDRKQGIPAFGYHRIFKRA